MKAFFYVGIILMFCLIFSCNSNNKTAGDTKATSKDSLADKKYLVNVVYAERARLDLPKYLISVKSKFWDPNKPIGEEDSSYYHDSEILYILDKKTNKLDSSVLEFSDNIDYHSRLAVQDFTDSLKFKNLLLYFSWIGASDSPWGQFVEHTKDTTRSLFDIYSMESIRRRDANTLEGFKGGRDEVVYNFQTDYPFIVSLKDYAVQELKPEKQYIGYPSEALEDIEIDKIGVPAISTLKIIKKGTPFIVDSIYRSTNTVRLIISDSIIINADIKELEDKISVNSAG